MFTNFISNLYAVFYSSTHRWWLWDESLSIPAAFPILRRLFQTSQHSCNILIDVWLRFLSSKHRLVVQNVCCCCCRWWFFYLFCCRQQVHILKGKKGERKKSRISKQIKSIAQENFPIPFAAPHPSWIHCAHSTGCCASDRKLNSCPSAWSRIRNHSESAEKRKSETEDVETSNENSFHPSS